MEKNNSRKDLVQIYADGKFWLEWSEVTKVVGVPRTTLHRMTDNLGLLKEEDIYQYKNRKLVRREWAFDFWRNVSHASKGKDLL